MSFETIAVAAPTANLSVNRTARKLRLRVPSALRSPAAGYLKRWQPRGYKSGTMDSGFPFCSIMGPFPRTAK
jgi:hypothetical protein